MSYRTLSALALGLCSLAALSFGHVLEMKIPLIDSLSGAVGPQRLTYNATSNKVYVGGNDGGYVVVIDAATRGRVARIDAGWAVRALCWNPADNKVYIASCRDDRLTIVDGATDSILTRVSLPRPTLLSYNSVSNKVYCGFSTSVPDSIAVIDGATNDIIARVPAGQSVDTLVYNSAANKAYAMWRDRFITVIDGWGDSVLTCIGTRDWPSALAVDSVRNRLYCSVASESGCVVLVIDGAGDSVTQRWELLDYADALLYVPRVKKLYAAFKFLHTVAVIDATCGSTVAAVSVSYEPMALCADAEGRSVFCMSEHGSSVDQIDCVTNRVIATVEVGQRRDPAALCYAGREHDLYCAVPDRDDVAVVSGPPEGQLYLARTAVAARPVVMGADLTVGKVYVADGRVGYVSVIDCATNRAARAIPVGGDPYLVVGAPELSKVYCTNLESNCISAIDCWTDRVTASVRLPGRPLQTSYCNQEAKLYCSVLPRLGIVDRLAVIDCRADTIRSVLRIGPLHSHCYSPVSNKLYVGIPRRDTIEVLDCATDTVVARIPYCSSGQWGYNAVNNKVYARVTIGDSGAPRKGGIVIIECARDSVRRFLEGVRATSYAHNYIMNKVYCAWAPGCQTAVVDGVTDSVLKVIRTPGGEQDLVHVFYNPIDNVVYHTSMINHVVTVIDCSTDSVILYIPTGRGMPWHSCFVPDVNRLYVGMMTESGVAVIKGIGASAVGENESGPVPRTGTRVFTSPFSLPIQHESSLYDAGGRLVARLMPGRPTKLDLAPAVYFLQTAPAGARQKVLVVR